MLGYFLFGGQRRGIKGCNRHGTLAATRAGELGGLAGVPGRGSVERSWAMSMAHASPVGSTRSGVTLDTNAYRFLPPDS